MAFFIFNFLILVKKVNVILKFLNRNHEYIVIVIYYSSFIKCIFLNFNILLFNHVMKD